MRQVLQLPIGKEGDFKGVVDLVQMKAIIWDDESLGATFQVTDIPDVEAANGEGSLKEQAEEYREKLPPPTLGSHHERQEHRSHTGSTVSDSFGARAVSSERTYRGSSVASEPV